MVHAVMKVAKFMEDRGLSDEERLRLLGSVSRLNGDAVAVKAILDSEGLSEEEQAQALRAIRTMIKPVVKKDESAEGDAPRRAKK